MKNFDYQGKRKDQIGSSQAAFVYSFAGLIILGCVYFIIELLKLLS